MNDNTRPESVTLREMAHVYCIELTAAVGCFGTPCCRYESMLSEEPQTCRKSGFIYVFFVL
jgi:hypothetical protein